jgi:SAM-dependent methyltransferase
MQKTLAEIINKLDTDKAQSAYIEKYERHVGHLRNNNVKILELGVFHGGSLLMWEEYFAKGLIVGLDMSPNPLKEMPERVRFYQGSQDDDALLDRLSQECAPDGFDIIIDDASHIGTITRASFRNLFMKHLKPGGIYVIEDWGTGYWSSWPDGSEYRMPIELSSEVKGQSITKHAVDPDFASHNFGMVGFIKELVDEVSWPDIIRGRVNNDIPKRNSLISEIAIYGGIVFMVKA